MSLLDKLFNRNLQKTSINREQSVAEEQSSHQPTFSFPHNHFMAMAKVGITAQTVLLNEDMIKSKELAELYASLISEKYGVKTKVSVTPDKSSYLIYVYRIDLDLIENLYDPTTNRWNFSLDALINAQAFNFDDAIKATPIGNLINAYLTPQFQKSNHFTLLFENSYYQFYKHFSRTLLRHEKQTERTLVIGRFVNVAACIQYHSKLYISETRGITGDKDIYQCDLNGMNLVALHCLSNEKIFRAGHSVSMDSVKEMHIVGDSLEITVMRNDGSNIYDYKIIITENEGSINIKQGF